MNSKETLFWSIALPGFGQFLNGKLIKGTIFIFLEFLVNVQGNINTVIIYSFQGEIETAISNTNYLWIMFYPCLYIFAIWDAYRDAGGGKEPYAFVPFVTSAYVMTIGLIYSSTFRIFDLLLGPIWLPILSVFPAIVLGLFIKSALSRHKIKEIT